MWSREVVAGRAAWRHGPSGVVFREVPGGTFRMGLSEGEADALRAIESDEDMEGFLEEAAGWGPARDVRVEPFLIARHPLTVDQVRGWLPDYEDNFTDDPDAVARVEDELEDLLKALPFRLPSEAEWEYAARAGTTTLTFRGNERPGEDQLIDEFGDEARTAAAENAFGLAGFGSAGEVCADLWEPGAADSSRVIRGGAADVAPWQGCDEWVLLLAVSRFEEGGFTAVRPVAAVPSE